MSVPDRRQLIKRQDASLSVQRQCALLSLNRASFYYQPQGEPAETFLLMRQIDEHYTAHPCYGSRRIRAVLARQGVAVSRERVIRLMRLMGIEGQQPGPRTTRPAPGHKRYPNLLRNVAVDHVGQVWASDITYLPMRTGTMYLTVIMDWYSRCILAWELSNTLDSDFCVRALRDALAQHAPPQVFHSDQGCQYTADAFTAVLRDHAIAISMSGRGRAYDNIFVERFWRSLKTEHLYKHDYDHAAALRQGVAEYLHHYNTDRPHQALGYAVPWEVHVSGLDTPAPPPQISSTGGGGQPAVSAPPTSSEPILGAGVLPAPATPQPFPPIRT